eukprot:142575_1
MAYFSFLKRLCELAFYINVIFFKSSHSYLELDIGLTYDDYLVREVVNFTSNGGWNNGDYLIDNSSTGIIYHGPFDEYTLGITSTLSRQLRVANYGYIRVNFTLIFGCDILNFTDNINLHFDRNAQAAEYYWIDTYSYDYSTNNYPYTTSNGFIIEEYYDSVLLDSSYCTNNINGIGNTISWAIHDSYLSPITYKPGDTFLFALTGRFNHDIPYNNDGKYWAVTNIVFELIHIQTEYPTFDPTQQPTINPITIMPTTVPTNNPITIMPTTVPTTIPTTISPTYNPITIMPTTVPTNNPITIMPTTVPTTIPTTISPTYNPITIMP